LKALEKCIDPELGEHVIDLGFIYDINIKKSKEGKSYEVDIFMTLTSPFCPMANYITSVVEENIKKIKSNSKLDIEIFFEPQWNPSMLSKDLQFAFFKQFMEE
jgi:metal-sulfur cluster biosynthetic enzyme